MPPLYDLTLRFALFFVKKVGALALVSTTS